MITLAKYDFNYIYPLIGKGKQKITLHTDHGAYSVKAGTDRLECFKRNHKCVTCNHFGSLFLLQSHVVGNIRNISCHIENCEWCAIHTCSHQVTGSITNPHLNMYHVSRRGTLILMTKDHIIPKSKGGPDNIDNLQTMCSVCNGLKADHSFEDFTANGFKSMKLKK